MSRFHLKIFMNGKRKIGPLGEELTVKFLVKRGYKILDRNYRRPWGELDVVAERKGVIHFVEVKALSSTINKSSVTHETPPELSEREKVIEYIRHAKPKDWYRPEENVSRSKMLRLSRIIQTYLMGKHVSDETAWQFDVATVLIDKEGRKAQVNLIENVILERRR